MPIARLATSIGALLLIMLGAGNADADMKPTVIDVLMGEPVPSQMMLDDLATVRMVFVGEFHTVKRHHRVQADILRGLSDRNKKLALGMEMFNIDQQPILDRWQAGGAGFGKLLELLGLDRWTNLHDYAPLIMLCRDKGIPIVALNAPDSLVKAVARKGIDGLEAKQLARIPKDVTDIDPLYDRLLRMRLRVHRAFEGKTLDNIVLAQALRDSIMARAAISFLESPRGSGRSMVVVAGAGHMNYGFGVPERVRRHSKHKIRIVLPTESGQLKLSEEERRQALPVTITHEDLTFIRRPIADYLHLIPLEAPPPKPHKNPSIARRSDTE